MTDPDMTPDGSAPDAAPPDVPDSGEDSAQASQVLDSDTDKTQADSPEETVVLPETPVSADASGPDESDPAGAKADADSQLAGETSAGSAGNDSASATDPSDMSAFEADVEDSELAKALKQIDQLTDDLAHARADLFNLNQQYGNYVRRSKDAASGHRQSGQQEVVESLLSVLDDIDAARAAGDLVDGPFASIATKLEDTLKTKFQVERFGQAGEDFDPAQHEALLSRDTSDVDHPVVGQVLQPGYKMGERVLRATKVMVHNPDPSQLSQPDAQS